MYKVETQEFTSYLAAVRAAEKIGAEVFEVSTGVRRWTPAPKVTAKRARRYVEQKAAFAAQQKLMTK
jgi:hypothetical protein